ncbi:hypothetical protein [Variovorax sp. 160MFSha2.1]|uniref:hypothetical protein n=1 Tax=Variovorax sp. 160MFSha2.1 TaxID=3158367 RepID=UPI003AAF2F70
MADPTVIECASACTVTVVHELSLPPLQLTPEEGAQIAVAVLVVWAVGWGVRQLTRLIQTSGPSTEKED